ncbi:hypothetical protein ACFFJY_17590 [Fictibacillus aquaticus]|uniref:Uncharacterized protein n=1 Tax=Fictibacillus aquaticus TaxID=2021314 RepID=A0A235F5T6_9BACL|nr:hypothetical protein [Fictibacillus aquaticus]OYD56641.1 hypothetical protein CGZ90_16660 [Fictibacillus aquaticus]
MKKYGLASIIFFLISALFYAAVMFGNLDDLFPGSVTIAVAVILPVAGLITSILSSKGAMRTIGLVGNLVVLFFSVIIPAASLLFWNQP